MSKISEQLVRQFADIGTISHYDGNVVLIHQGATDRVVFLLVSGCVKITAQLDNGNTALLAIRAGGDVVGELAVVDGHERSATVRTCSPTVAITLDAARFAETLGPDVAAWLALMGAISAKFRAAIRRHTDHTGTTKVVALARVLVELATTYGDTSSGTGLVIGINLNQAEWATLIGASEATAHRALTDLRIQGLITTRNRRMIVRDLDRLRAVAYPDTPSNDGQ
ncbi:Crp/Fnr family transcriptional regulator [Kibdelosporangium lantanae]|uniref:Crp/Fnr family transcriptional regulator n=1 Tax=Kibdelosporangium lantanae TaxID=1497396 RepID=A0ABW3M0L0_9PSEU